MKYFFFALPSLPIEPLKRLHPNLRECSVLEYSIQIHRLRTSFIVDLSKDIDHTRSYLSAFAVPTCQYQFLLELFFFMARFFPWN